MKDLKKMHGTWWKFEKFLISNFGKDYHDNLSGFEAMDKVAKYVKSKAPEIKIVRCDDSFHASSDLVLVPHPKHGITVIFIPQCTTINNQFFLYENHLKTLTKELALMKGVYKTITTKHVP
jgi:hypothetical protein